MLVLISLFACLFVCTASAEDAYLQPIPEELKIADDTVTHFIVFEESKYFSVQNGNTINGLNTDQMVADMNTAGIDTTKIGTEYLIRYNFPKTINETVITSINLNAFKSNTYFSNVCGYIQFANTVKYTSDMRDNCSKLRCIDFGENSELTSIPHYFCTNGAGSKLVSVKNFPTNLTEVGTEAFNGCYGAFSGDLYVNAKKISGNAFNNAVANVTSITFGPLVESIDGQAFTVRMAELTSFKPSDSAVQIRKIVFLAKASNITFNQNAFYFGGSWARTSYSKLEEIVLLHVDDEKLVKENDILSQYTSSVVAFDANTEDDYVTTYHDFSILNDILYDSFLEAGNEIHQCSKCGVTSVGDVAEALFKCIGFSYFEGERGGITISFAVNKNAISNYTTKTSKTLEYGLFAVLDSKIGQNDAINTDGTNVNGVASVSMSKYAYDIIEFRITGITTDTHKAEKIVFGAYVIEASDSEKTVSYMQANNADEGKKYSSVSYNELVGIE